jgi:hypothetical protein
MKRRVVIEIEETIIEARIVVPGNIHCPACGAIVSSRASAENIQQFKRLPLVETIAIKPESTKLLEREKE